MITRAADIRPGDRIMHGDTFELVTNVVMSPSDSWVRISVVPRSPFDIGKDYYHHSGDEMEVRT